jgi:hypothetical protein
MIINLFWDFGVINVYLLLGKFHLLWQIGILMMILTDQKNISKYKTKIQFDCSYLYAYQAADNQR